VLLVHDHEAERGARREHGRARADHHRGPARCGGTPGLEARAVGERGVQRDDGCGEPRAEAGDELRRERDFWHQHECAAACGEHALDQVQVHLGLAAAGDAVQQEGAELPERCADALDGRGLVRGKHRAGPAFARGRCSLGPCERLEPPAPRKRTQGRRMARRGDRRGRRAGVADECDERLLSRAEPRAAGDGLAPGRRLPPDDFIADRGPAQAEHLRHRAEQHVAQRLVVVVRRPAQQAERRLVPDRRGVDRFEGRLQLRARQGALGCMRDDQAHRPLPAEGNAHPLARSGKGPGRRREVVE